MSSIVLKPTQETYQKIIDFYQSFRLNKQVPYTQLVAKKAGTTITVYTSGKVMFQGPQAETEANQWGKTEAKQTTKTRVGSLPKNFKQLSVIGSDEVGNGSYFGPLVVCAAFAPTEQLTLLQELGVRDSKMLTDPQIKQISTKLKKILNYHLLIVSPEKYNQIQPKYNAVHMKVALHNQAIYLLLQKIAPKKPEAILIDQFTPETNYRKYVAAEKNQVSEKIYFATKGEQYHLAVASASILCRAAFLEELEKYTEELGFIIPSGAGKKSDEVAAKILTQGGMEQLSKYAKLHFANTEKAKKLI